jgi:hypothetical protein
MEELDHAATGDDGEATPSCDRRSAWPRRAFRLIVAVAVVALLCVVGYRRGYQRGYEVVDPLAVSAGSSGSIYPVAYPVADLVQPAAVNPIAPSQARGPGGSSGPPVADFDPLIDLIVSTIDPESWAENLAGGQGEIQPFPSNLSLVIAQTQRLHEQVADLFVQLRRTQGTVQPQEFVPMLQSQAAYGRDGAHSVRTFPDTAAGRAALGPLFDSAVANLVDLWGAPAIRSEVGAADFPKWSTAEQVAAWRRGGGMAYLVLEDDGQSAPQVLAGWRRDED